MDPARATRRQQLAGAALLALAAAILLGPWVVSDRMPGGDFPGYAARIQAVRDALLESGRVPRWCVECYGGTTEFTGNFKEYLAFPLAWLSDPVTAGKGLFAGLCWLAAVGLFCVVVRLFAAPGAGLVAAYAYGFGAVTLHQYEHLDAVLACALLPAQLLAALALYRRPGWAAPVALAVLSALQLSNNWVHAAPSLFAVAALGLLRPWRGAEDAAALAPGWPLRLVCAAALFVVLAASQLAWTLADAANHRLVPAQFMPALNSIYAEWSPFRFLNRGEVLDGWLATHHPPGLDVAAWDRGGRYLGVSVLGVVLIGSLALRSERRLLRWSGFAGLLFLVQYGLALGSWTLLEQVGGSLHWSDGVQAALRLGLGIAAAGCAVGAGWSGWRGRTAPDPRSARPQQLALGAALLAFPIVSPWQWARALVPLLDVQRSPGHYFDTAAFWLCLAFAAALTALLRRVRSRARAGALLAAAALLVVLDLRPATRALDGGVPLDALRPSAAALAQLPGEAGAVRLVLPPGFDPLASWLAEQAATGHAWGWLPWKASPSWPALVRVAAWEGMTDASGDTVANVPLLSAARIRYFLLPGAGAHVRLPPPWRERFQHEHFSLWELPEVGPQAAAYRDFVALAELTPAEEARAAGRALDRNLLVLSAESGSDATRRLGERARLVLSPSTAPRWVEPARQVTPESAWEARLRRAPSPAPAPLAVERAAPERIAVDLRPVAERSVVFVSEGYHPWWRAEVDGAPARLWRANASFLGVPVEPGAARLELVLTRPAVVAAADWLGRAAWGVVVLASVARGLRRVRRRREFATLPE